MAGGIGQFQRIATLAAGLAITVAAGCSTRPSARPPATPISASRPAATTRNARADLPLSALPALALPASRPVPAGPAPLEALELYAAARDAMNMNQRVTAVNLLNRAIAIDPDSFELQRALGDVSGVGLVSSDTAITAYERALEIRPRAIEVRLQLARQYLAKGDTASGIAQLRLARLCDGYRKMDDQATIVELWLARSLRHQGYEAAALELFESLLARLRNPSMALRKSRENELIYLLSRPQEIELAAAQLYEKRGDLKAALAHFEQFAAREPYAWDARRKIVQLLLSMDRRDEAIARASDLVISRPGDSAALGLLRDTYREVGREDQLVPGLRSLLDRQPTSRALLLALADALEQHNGHGEAVAVLRQSLARRYDAEVLRRLIDLHRSGGDLAAAARLLIEINTAHPQATGDITPMWLDMARFSNRARLRVATVQKLALPSTDLEPARQFWISRLATLHGREPLARTALELAARGKPLFPPAARAQVDQLWQRSDMTEPARIAAAKELADAARRDGNVALAAELTAISLINQGANDPARIDDALVELALARKLGGDSPDMLLMEARALIRRGYSSRAEQLLWKLASDHPQFEDAYGLLYQQYAGNPSAQEQVLDKWLAATPRSANGRMLKVLALLQQRQRSGAEQLLDQILADESDNVEILGVIASLYQRSDRLGDFVARLDRQIAERPTNLVAVQQLVAIHLANGRMTDVLRILAAARSAAARDADLLYYLGGIYSRIEQKDLYEQVLQQVMAVDPAHASAANDLGYNWADEGRNLTRAEELIRLAVREEPDNHSYLDSLGWVLYKRGRFEEAHKYLDEAAAASSAPDPVVLDHLGDVLFRLGRRDEAVKTWQRTMKRLRESESDRPDIARLRVDVAGKLGAAAHQQPVRTAPAGDELTGATRPSTQSTRNQSAAEARSIHGRS